MERRYQKDCPLLASVGTHQLVAVAPNFGHFCLSSVTSTEDDNENGKSQNGAITSFLMNSSRYVRHLTIFSSMRRPTRLTACCHGVD